MSTVSSFIQSNALSSMPKQIDGLWFYTDDSGNLYITNGNSNNSITDYLVEIPANFNGNSLLTYSNGNSYTINSGPTTNYSYKFTPTGTLYQQDFTNYLINTNPDTITAVTRSSWDGENSGQAMKLKAAIDYIQNNLGIKFSNATFSGFSDGGMGAALLPKTLGLQDVQTKMVFFDSNFFEYMNSGYLDYVQDNVEDFDVVFFKSHDGSTQHLEEFTRRKIPFTMIAVDDYGLASSGELTAKFHNLYHFFPKNGNPVNLYKLSSLSELADFVDIRGENPYKGCKAYRYTYDENGNVKIEEISLDDAIYKISSTGYEYMSKTDFSQFKERIENLSKYLFTAQDFGGDKKLSSDQTQALKLMNSIRSAVTSQESLSAIANGFAVDSTTMVPTSERDYVAKYFEFKLRILEKIVNETVSVLETAFDIDLEDKKLALEWEKIPESEPVDTSSNNDGSGGSGYNYTRYANNNFTSVKVEEKTDSETDDNAKDDIYDEFLAYDEVVTTDNRYVEDKNDYKMLIYHEGDKVLGVEYYYDFGSLEKADEMFNPLIEKYKNIDGFDKIIQNGQYIKVTFDPDYVGQLSLADATKQYGGSNETI